ncbi:MAG: hypothetical protein HY735_28835 [Verrucomicrobia bacterium]|nr:hypothetical protein [Verrucomicrobiota bacterium]
MKTLLPVLLLSILTCVDAYSQAAPPGKTSLHVLSGKKGSETIASSGAKTPPKKTEPRVFYGGVLADLKGSNKSSKPTDLRYSPKPKQAGDNVYTDPQTGAAKGFVIFAIKF